ncbi:MAG: hypothetical protein MUO77_10105 [Anaerolineales bacterium]|nr:hypothetical protein [Anaerolineales bacterium]
MNKIPLSKEWGPIANSLPEILFLHHFLIVRQSHLSRFKRVAAIQL